MGLHHRPCVHSLFFGESILGTNYSTRLRKIWQKRHLTPTRRDIKKGKFGVAFCAARVNRHVASVTVIVSKCLGNKFGRSAVLAGPAREAMADDEQQRKEKMDHVAAAT